MKLDSIRDIVSEVIGELGQDEHYRLRLTSFALSFFRTWMFDSARQVRTLVTEMDALKRVDIPDDYIDWTRVGIRVGDQIKTIRVNDDVSKISKYENGEPVKFTEANCAINTLPDNFNAINGYWYLNPYGNVNRYGEHLGGFFGVGEGYYNGYFSVLTDVNKFQFSSDIQQTEVYIEYLAHPFNPCEESMVHPYATEAMKYYIMWKYYFHVTKNMGMADRMQMEYKRELQDAKIRMYPLTKEDVLKIIRGSYMQAPKG